MLEDKADLPLADGEIGCVRAMEMNPSRAGLIQAGDDAQQGGFPRPGRPEQRDQFAGLDLQIDVVQRREFSEPAGDVACFDAHMIACL